MFDSHMVSIPLYRCGSEFWSIKCRVAEHKAKVHIVLLRISSWLWYNSDNSLL